MTLTKTTIFRIINSANNVLKQSAFGFHLHQSFKAIQISEQLTLNNYIHELCDDLSPMRAQLLLVWRWGSELIFLRKPIATCDFPVWGGGGAWGPPPPPPHTHTHLLDPPMIVFKTNRGMTQEGMIFRVTNKQRHDSGGHDFQNKNVVLLAIFQTYNAFSHHDGHSFSYLMDFSCFSYILFVATVSRDKIDKLFSHHITEYVHQTTELYFSLNNHNFTSSYIRTININNSNVLSINYSFI